MPPRASDRPLVRILLAGDGRATTFALKRLIAAAPDLVDVAQAAVVFQTRQLVHDLQPDVVVLDCTLSPRVLLLARELTSLDHAPAVVACPTGPESAMTIPAIVAGVRGIVTRSDLDGALCDAIRWVAGMSRWLPEIPLPALSRAGSRLERDDLPILLKLLRGMPAPDIAADLGITAASLEVRRSAILRDMLSEPALAWGRRMWHSGASASAPIELDPRIAIAA